MASERKQRRINDFILPIVFCSKNIDFFSSRVQREGSQGNFRISDTHSQSETCGSVPLSFQEYHFEPYTKEQIEQIINELFPIQQDMKDFQIQRVEDNKSQFIKAYKADDNGNFRNSMWGLINAYSDYITHREPARKTSRV